MFPLVPFLCIAAIVGGTGGLFWYENRSEGEKKRANELAAEFAWKLFGKAVTNLTRDQAEIVAARVRDQIGV